MGIDFWTLTVRRIGISIVLGSVVRNIPPQHQPAALADLSLNGDAKLSLSVVRFKSVAAEPSPVQRQTAALNAWVVLRHECGLLRAVAPAIIRFGTNGELENTAFPRLLSAPFTRSLRIQLHFEQGLLSHGPAEVSPFRAARQISSRRGVQRMSEHRERHLQRRPADPFPGRQGRPEPGRGASSRRSRRNG